GATAMRRLNAGYRGRAALLGDASGSVDAITGEGLCLSFRQPPAFVQPLEQGDLESYQRAHRRLARLPNLVSRLLLWLGEIPVLRQRAMRTMARDVSLFRRFLAGHLGETSAWEFAGTSLRFGCQFLAA